MRRHRNTVTQGQGCKFSGGLCKLDGGREAPILRPSVNAKVRDGRAWRGLLHPPSLSRALAEPSGSPSLSALSPVLPWLQFCIFPNYTGMQSNALGEKHVSGVFKKWERELKWNVKCNLKAFSWIAREVSGLLSIKHPLDSTLGLHFFYYCIVCDWVMKCWVYFSLDASRFSQLCKKILWSNFWLLAVSLHHLLSHYFALQKVFSHSHLLLFSYGCL